MRVTIDSTTQAFESHGVPCQIWEGTTNSGIAIRMLVARIVPEPREDSNQFVTELANNIPPQIQVDNTKLYAPLGEWPC